jgi:hypothetical protein
VTDQRTIDAMVAQIRRNQEWRENMARLAEERKFKRRRARAAATPPEDPAGDSAIEDVPS